MGELQPEGTSRFVLPLLGHQSFELDREPGGKFAPGRRQIGPRCGHVKQSVHGIQQSWWGWPAAVECVNHRGMLFLGDTGLFEQTNELGPAAAKPGHCVTPFHHGDKRGARRRLGRVLDTGRRQRSPNGSIELWGRLDTDDKGRSIPCVEHDGACRQVPDPAIPIAERPDPGEVGEEASGDQRRWFHGACRSIQGLFHQIGNRRGWRRGGGPRAPIFIKWTGPEAAYPHHGLV